MMSERGGRKRKGFRCPSAVVCSLRKSSTLFMALALSALLLHGNGIAANGPFLVFALLQVESSVWSGVRRRLRHRL